MASPIHLPRHDDRVGLLVDAFIDASIGLDTAVLTKTPDEWGEGVIQFLRIATALANEVAGIPGAYQREVVQC